MYTSEPFCEIPKLAAPEPLGDDPLEHGNRVARHLEPLRDRRAPRAAFHSRRRRCAPWVRSGDCSLRESRTFVSPVVE